MKFTIDIERKSTMLDHHFEVQAMDNFIYTQSFSSFGANKDYKKFAEKILKEMVVVPVEARNLDFFENDFEGLTQVIEQLMEVQDAFMKPLNKRKGLRKKQH